jgi:hypothetical protein
VTLRTPSHRALVRALLLAAVAAALLALALPGPATAADETAKVTYTSCTPAPAAPVAGITIAGVRVAKMGCVLGKAVTVDYTKCRLANGAAGRCVKKVRGFACFEIRRNNPDGSFAAQVSCAKGDKRVKHSYTQVAGVSP